MCHHLWRVPWRYFNENNYGSILTVEQFLPPRTDYSIMACSNNHFPTTPVVKLMVSPLVISTCVFILPACYFLVYVFVVKQLLFCTEDESITATAAVFAAAATSTSTEFTIMVCQLWYKYLLVYLNRVMHESVLYYVFNYPQLLYVIWAYCDLHLFIILSSISYLLPVWSVTYFYVHTRHVMSIICVYCCI